MFCNLIKRINIKNSDLILVYPTIVTKTIIQNKIYTGLKKGPILMGLKFDERKNNVPIVKTIFKYSKTKIEKLFNYAKNKNIQIEKLNSAFDEDEYIINKKIPTCRYKEIAEIYSKRQEKTTYDFISKFTKKENLLQIQLGYALIPLVVKGSKYDCLSNFCCEVRDKIYRKTGIILPYFIISDNTKLKSMEFEFIINEEPVLRHNFRGIQLIEIGMCIREFVETEINKNLNNIVNPKWLMEYMDNYDNEKVLAKCLLKKHIPAEFVLDVIHVYINKNKKIDLNLAFETISNNYERTKKIDEIIAIIDWIKDSERIYQQKTKKYDIYKF